MTTATTTLTDFLLAQIAADEALAREVIADMPRWDVPSWHEDMEPFAHLPGPRLNARMSPDRVLAQCAAMRLLIERIGNPDWAGFRILASIYADHPDFREEWRA